jgi:hypothetical protein
LGVTTHIDVFIPVDGTEFEWLILFGEPSAPTRLFSGSCGSVGVRTLWYTGYYGSKARAETFISWAAKRERETLDDQREFVTECLDS